MYCTHGSGHGRTEEVLRGSLALEGTGGGGRGAPGVHDHNGSVSCFKIPKRPKLVVQVRKKRQKR